MGSHKKLKKDECPDVDVGCDEICPPKTEDVEDKIYRALDVAEKIAVKLTRLNGYIKKAKKKGQKKDKKLGKFKKKTGFVVLKKEKKQKKEKALKRYKPPKKK